MNTIDILLLIVIIMFTFISAKRGFLRSVLNLGAVFLAGLLSKLLSGPAAYIIYTSFIQKGVTHNLYKIMPSGSVSGEINNVIDDIFSQLPDFVVNCAERFGVSEQVLSLNDSTVLNVEYIEHNIVMPIITGVAAIIATAIFFIILSFIFKIIIFAVDKKIKNKKLKLVNSTDFILGGVLGFIRAAFPMFFICIILNFIASQFNNTDFAVLVDSSMFCKFVQNIF